MPWWAGFYQDFVFAYFGVGHGARIGDMLADGKLIGEDVAFARVKVSGKCALKIMVSWDGSRSVSVCCGGGL